MRIGPNIPIAKGLIQALENGVTIKANALQVFTGNPRGGAMRSYSPQEIDRVRQKLESHFKTLICHAPYALNLASDKADIRQSARDLLGRALDHADQLGAEGLVLHPGSHKGQGRAKGIALIIQGLEEVLSQKDRQTRIYLEGMTGSGHEIGGDLRDLADIRKGLAGDRQPLICLDTAHLWGAGIDISSPAHLKDLLEDHFPLDAIGCLHLNDSKVAFGSKKDVHARLGQGQIGLPLLQGLVCDPFFAGLPLILETPNDLKGWQEEIALVRSWHQI